MSRADALARGRAMAEASMIDACIIRRQTGSTTDPDTGARTPTYSSLYAGPCRVQQHQASADRQDAGQDYALMLRLEVQLPMSVIGLQVADEITMTASVNDGDLPGRVFKIHDLAHKTEATARRVQCIEKTG